MLIAGRSTAQIAEALGLAVVTVRHIRQECQHAYKAASVAAMLAAISNDAKAHDAATWARRVAHAGGLGGRRDRRTGPVERRAPAE